MICRDAFVPGGGLAIPTDRDQRSSIFFNDPKNISLPKENPKKYFPKSETLTLPSQNPIHLAKVKCEMIIMKNCTYWNTRWIKLDLKKYCRKHKTLKNTAFVWQPKNTAAMTSTQKNTDTPLIPVCKYAKSTPCGICQPLDWERLVTELPE